MDRVVEEKIQNFFADGIVKKYAKGQIITMAGESPGRVTLLVYGVVEQYDITPEGNKVIVNLFKPPAFFPMSWAINRTPNEYIFSAVTAVTLRSVDADSAVEFLKSNPDVMFDLLSRVYKGADALLKRLVLAASGVASNRLVFELLIEAYRFGAEIESGVWTIRIKQSELASRSGLARETISRELHKLETDSYISRTKDQLILYVPKLEEKLKITV